MKVSDREQKIVLRYFQSGKLDTPKAWQKVMARVGNWEEVEYAKKARVIRMRPLHWIAVTASLLILVAVGAYTLLQPKVVTFSSDVEVVACHLPDGTQVMLAPHSSLSYLADNCRSVEMKGCAYFQVKHDEQHPFDVNGERGHVRVLGTQFLVDERKEGTSEVIVTSGKVFFSARDAHQGILLTKGKQARLLLDAEKPEMMGECNVNDVAWATHQLHFDNTPLQEVLQELSKYGNGLRLRATNMNKRLTGDFCTDSIPQAIQIIEQTLDVKVISE